MTLKDERQWTIVDPLQRDGFETSQGYLIPGQGGYITTKNADLAQEIREREPHAIVTEHVPMRGGKATRFQITVPSVGIFADKKYWFEMRGENGESKP